MTATGRRITPRPPRLVGRSWNDVTTELQSYLEAATQAADNGLPPPHGPSHNTTGADPLTTPGPPSNVATAAAVGAGPAYALESHVHALTLAVLRSILGTTTKGDILADTGSTLVRVPVGANSTLLEAASGATPGVQWSTLLVVLGRLLDTPGSIIVRDATVPAKLAAPAESYRHNLVSAGPGGAPVWQPRWSYIGGPTVATGVAADAVTIALLAGESCAGVLVVSASAGDGTDTQRVLARAPYAVVRDAAGVYTGVGALVVTTEANPCSSGTLTVTAAAASGTDQVKLQITVTSSLAGAALSAFTSLLALDDQSAVVL